MIPITPKEILWINYCLARGKGSPRGVDEVKLLKAALLRPKSSFAGKDLYPDIYTKAASLSEFIMKGRPFKSANTSTAVAAGLLLLQKNGIKIQGAEGELTGLNRNLPSNTAGLQEWANCFKSLTMQ